MSSKSQDAREPRADSPLRVLGVDPELGFAGGETQVLGLTLGLLRNGHRAELACDPRGQLYERARRESVECHPLAIHSAIDFAAGLRLRALLTGARYDVVHFHTSRAHSMAPFARGHADALIVTRRMDYRPNRLFAPYLYNRAVDAVAAISHRVADALGEAGVARDHLRIIASGVDCEHFRPASSSERETARARLDIATGDFFVGTVGALEGRKGHRYLLQAIARLKRDRGARSRIKCAIAGAGAMRDDLAHLARELGIANDTLFLGMVGDTRQLLDALDLFVFPSLQEGLGVALLEAMACGLPVVATRAGGIVDAVEDHQNGLLVSPCDAAAIAAAIVDLENDASWRARLGSAARARIAENFSMDTMTQKTIDLYRACLMRRARNAEEVRH
ncbi:MAG TPA: glycosyltransferase family 4 protein [Candidatus Binataceae bacterium]|nr:glycosyltransferase family 4 protein [Candidatus Binataceae bacterium]